MDQCSIDQKIEKQVTEIHWFFYYYECANSVRIDRIRGE